VSQSIGVFISQSNFDIALHLAKFLDQDDFLEASNLMAEHCVYSSPDGEIVGPENIAASYREHSARAHKLFDSVIYKSKVVKMNDNQFEMMYTDIISKNGKTHNYSCKQIITVKNQLIESIRHEEIPTEYEKIKSYYKEVGL
jgi:hypothetical protein